MHHRLRDHKNPFDFWYRFGVLLSLQVGQKSQVVIPNFYERLTATQPHYRDKNTLDVESNQYGEVVRFFQEIRIDIKACIY